MLSPLKELMQQGNLPAIAYHFAEYIYQKSADTNVALAAALLSWQHSQGHVCIDLSYYADKVLFKRDDFDGLKTPALHDWLYALQQHPWVAAQFPAPLILDNQQLYLGKYWQFETRLADTILTRLSIPNDTLCKETLGADLQRLFPRTSEEVDWQAIAAATAVLNRFVVISGGPGTGKTATVIRILALLLAQNSHIKIELVAPTGKAAARLAESIQKGKVNPFYTLSESEKQLIPATAKTIHRLLRYSPQGFYYNKHKRIAVDVLIVDEASMVDLPLMTRLLEAVPAQTQIILLGDKDQLASVEAGSVLSDISAYQQEHVYSESFIAELAALGVVQTTQMHAATVELPPIARCIALLHKSYRFDDHSGIGQAAKWVNARQGKKALYAVLLAEQYPDVTWQEHMDTGLDQRVIEWAIQHYRTYLDCDNVATALQHFEKFRILTALRQSAFGVEAINQHIISRLMQLSYIQASEEFHGKPIMITHNDYELDLFNGDIGLLWTEPSNTHLYAYFPSHTGEVRKLSIRQLPEHETAFAMTIHKSQGSEFEHLLLILPDEMQQVLTKELIYTGISRAKQRLMVAGNQSTFIQACSKTVQRQSGLAKKLGW